MVDYYSSTMVGFDGDRTNRRGRACYCPCPKPRITGVQGTTMFSMIRKKTLFKSWKLKADNSKVNENDRKCIIRYDMVNR